jgi:hypothetical protein
MTAAGSLTYPVYLIHGSLGGYLIHRTRDSLGSWGAVLLATGAVLVSAHLIQRFVGPGPGRAAVEPLGAGAGSAPLPVGVRVAPRGTSA